MKHDWENIDLNEIKTTKEKGFDPIRHETYDVLEKAMSGIRPDDEGVCAVFAWGLSYSPSVCTAFPGALEEFHINGELKFKEELAWLMTADQRVVFCTIATAYENALNGDEECKNFLIKIYKKCFKKEYDVLRRMRTMSSSELEGIIDVKKLEDTGRVLGIANVMGIELDERIALLERDILRWWAKRNDNMPKPDENEIKIREVGSKILKAQNAGKHTKENRAQSATKEILKAMGKKEDDPKHWMGFYDREKKDTAYIAGLLKRKYPDREYETDEYHLYVLILRLIRAFYATTENMYRMYEAAFYNEKPEVIDKEQKEDTIDEDEEKIKSFEKEVARLKAENKIKDSDIEAIANDSREKEKECEELRRELKKASENNAELYKLREYAYTTTKEEEIQKSDDEIKELETFLKDKHIVIIGGHENWHRMLKNVFPKWKYYGAEADPGISLSSLSGADAVFFFTGYLGHVNYYKAIGIVRKNNIDFGYINSTNYEKTLEQIENGIITK